MPKLLYQGHGSFRLTADDGRVIYVDPYKGKGYDLPADIILVTHNHRDHNQIGRCAQLVSFSTATARNAASIRVHSWAATAKSASHCASTPSLS